MEMDHVCIVIRSRSVLPDVYFALMFKTLNLSCRIGMMSQTAKFIRILSEWDAVMFQLGGCLGEDAPLWAGAFRGGDRGMMEETPPAGSVMVWPITEHEFTEVQKDPKNVWRYVAFCPLGATQIVVLEVPSDRVVWTGRAWYYTDGWASNDGRFVDEAALSFVTTKDVIISRMERTYDFEYMGRLLMASLHGKEEYNHLFRGNSVWLSNRERLEYLFGDQRIWECLLPDSSDGIYAKYDLVQAVKTTLQAARDSGADWDSVLAPLYREYNESERVLQEKMVAVRRDF